MNRAERIVFWLTMLLLLIFSVITGIAQATVPVVTVTVSPQTAVSSATPSITWNAPGAANCVASGGWSGTKAASGTVTLTTPITTIGVTTFGLTCTSLTGPITLNWTPPTLNTDGSPLTNLGGYKFFYGANQGTWTTTLSVANPTLSTYRIGDVPTGLKWFTMRAFNSALTESDETNPVSATIVADSGSGSGTLTITAPPAPKAPTNFTVSPGP